MDWRLVLASVATVVGAPILFGLLVRLLDWIKYRAQAPNDLPDHHTYGDSPLVPKGLRGRSEHGGVAK